MAGRSPRGVLLIGFDRIGIERMTAFLAQAGHQAYAAGDGREAAEALRAVAIDLALVDLEGPFKEVLAGIEAVRAGGRPHCPILGVGSVEAGAAMVDALRALDLAGLVAPGVSAQELVFRVNAALHAGTHAGTRASRRVPVDFPATFEGPHGRHAGRVLNLSETGLFLAAEHPVGANQTVSVSFALAAGAEPIEATCRVAWANPARGGHRYFQGMGLEFLDLSPAARSALGAFLASVSEDPDWTAAG